MAAAAGWDVSVVHPPDEAEAAAPPRRPGETTDSFVLRIARAKGEAVAATGVTGTILACDTLGEIDGMALGKPTDRDDARRMLTLLSGRTHRVVTGVWLSAAGRRPPEHDTPRILEAVEESLLAMDPLEPELIEWYLDSGLWHGKAGGCGFQDERLPLRLVSGSGSNVVGLPIERIEGLLAELRP